MAVYPSQITYSAYIDSDWIDITSDVVGGEQCSYGIMGSDQNERVASPGEMKIKLRNDTDADRDLPAGRYNPGSDNAYGDWNINTKILQQISYGSTIFQKVWYVIEIDPNEVNGIFVNVVCSDFMYYAGRDSINLPAVLFDTDIKESAQALIAIMDAAPLTTSYDDGSVNFPTMFDYINRSATPLSEFAKIALSEFGYIYLRRSEQFTVEGRTTRIIADKVTYFTDPTDRYLLLEDGDFLLQETGDKILLDEESEAFFDNYMTAADVYFGSQIKNYVKFTAYPRRTDSAATSVLFNLETSISLDAGETKEYWAKYSDPDNEAQRVSGIDMVTPVATTHYLMNANSDGTGANLTGDLSVTATYFSQDILYELENTGASNGYVTFLQAVGKGIYVYTPLDYITEDATSISTYGQNEFAITMQYQNNPDNLIGIADKLLAQDKDPRTNLTSITFVPNYSALLMTMFVTLDIGDLIKVSEDTSGVNERYYYIQNINYDIQPGGFITVTYGVLEALSFGEQYWLLGDVGFGELGEKTYLGY